LIETPRADILGRVKRTENDFKQKKIKYIYDRVRLGDQKRPLLDTTRGIGRKAQLLASKVLVDNLKRRQRAQIKWNKIR
jgi:hypothetical protein